MHANMQIKNINLIIIFEITLNKSMILKRKKEAHSSYNSLELPEGLIHKIQQAELH